MQHLQRVIVQCLWFKKVTVQCQDSNGWTVTVQGLDSNNWTITVQI
jgi:hypothetical protein